MEPDFVNIFANYGAVGIIAGLGVWFANTAYRREIKRGDAYEEQLRVLNAAVRDKLVPTMESATSAVRASQELLVTMRTQQEVAAKVVEEMTRQDLMYRADRQRGQDARTRQKKRRAPGS